MNFDAAALANYRGAFNRRLAFLFLSRPNGLEGYVQSHFDEVWMRFGCEPRPLPIPIFHRFFHIFHGD
jgi:hypothetical protein